MARLGSTRILARAAALAAALQLAWSPPARAGEAPELRLSIDSPQADGAIAAPLGLALITGRARSGPQRALDLVIAIDTSHSTASSVRAERRSWKRWLAWLLRREPEALEPAPFELGMRRALALLDELDPALARVGVVAFADRARLEAPLGDPGRARDALLRLRERGASGATNLLDALERARVELTGELGAAGRPRGDARRLALLITDGVDVHPFHPDPGEARALLAASARALRSAGVELVAIATRAGAEAAPIGAIAQAGGRLHAQGDALSSLAAVDPARVQVRHTGSGTLAATSELPGGGFAALVPLAPGSNRVEVRARTRSGHETRRMLELVWNPAEPERALSLELLRIRNDLLADHLRALHAHRRMLTRALVIAPAR